MMMIVVVLIVLLWWCFFVLLLLLIFTSLSYYERRGPSHGANPCGMIQQWPVTTAVYIVCEDDIYWTQADAVERGKDSE